MVSTAISDRDSTWENNDYQNTQYVSFQGLCWGNILIPSCMQCKNIFNEHLDAVTRALIRHT